MDIYRHIRHIGHIGHIRHIRRILYKSQSKCILVAMTNIANIFRFTYFFFAFALALCGEVVAKFLATLGVYFKLSSLCVVCQIENVSKLVHFRHCTFKTLCFQDCTFLLILGWVLEIPYQSIVFVFFVHVRFFTVTLNVSNVSGNEWIKDFSYSSQRNFNLLLHVIVCFVSNGIRLKPKKCSKIS